MRIRHLFSGAMVGVLICLAVATPAAQSSAQIQAALQLFLQQAHSWTQTQTFQNVVINGTCTGSGCGGGGGTIGGSIADTQVAVGSGADTIGGSAALTFTTELFASRQAVDGDIFELLQLNTSDTADSAVRLNIYTTGDNATGDATFLLGVHGDGANDAALEIVVSGDSGNATPDTTFSFPGSAVLKVPGNENSFQLNESTTTGELTLSSAFKTDSGQMDYGYTEWTMRGINADGGSGASVFGFGFEANVSSTDVVTNQNFYIFDHQNEEYLLAMTPTTVAFFALKATGAASGKTVVCADANGILYRSSTGTDCSN